jgi:hypothetical protein
VSLEFVDELPLSDGWRYAAELRERPGEWALIDSTLWADSTAILLLGHLGAAGCEYVWTVIDGHRSLYARCPL